MLTMAALAAALPGIAQQAPEALTGFEPNGDYLFQENGVTVEDAQIFGRAGAFLITAESLEQPILIEVRSREVETVNLLKVAKQEDGTLDLLAGAAAESLGSWQMIDGGEGISFALPSGATGVMRSKPPLLGEHDPDEIVAYNAAYAKNAAAYTCSEPLLRQLRAQDQAVKVRVYFGSWCPYCKQMVPRMIKVAHELEGSKIAVEFYGLPHQITTDREAESLGISSVPTGIVYIGGREVGRISGESWKIPELALKRVIDSA